MKTEKQFILQFMQIAELASNTTRWHWRVGIISALRNTSHVSPAVPVDLSIASAAVLLCEQFFAGTPSFLAAFALGLRMGGAIVGHARICLTLSGEKEDHRGNCQEDEH